jgi:Uma2 family endonuclease
MIHTDPYAFYSYQDYLALREDVGRFEIIEGLLLGAASPSPLHQIISKRLLVKFEQYLENKSCQVFGAPLEPVQNLLIGR